MTAERQNVRTGVIDGQVRLEFDGIDVSVQPRPWWRRVLAALRVLNGSSVVTVAEAINHGRTAIPAEGERRP